jgi:hypothetical protein
MDKNGNQMNQDDCDFCFSRKFSNSLFAIVQLSGGNFEAENFFIFEIKKKSKYFLQLMLKKIEVQSF